LWQDFIPVKILKSGGKHLLKGLFQSFKYCWKSDALLRDWKILAMWWKSKEDLKMRQVCKR